MCQILCAKCKVIREHLVFQNIDFKSNKNKYLNLADGFSNNVLIFNQCNSPGCRS